MEKKVSDKRVTIIRDIINAEKFFDRTGAGIKQAYKCIDQDIDKLDELTGRVNTFLYIPKAENDMYPLFLN